MFDLSLTRLAILAFLGLTLAGGQPRAVAQTPPSNAAGEAVSLTTLRQQTRQLLSDQAALPDGESKQAAAASLCDWYVILRSDPRYTESEMLRGDAAKVRRRLLSIAQQQQAELKRNGIVKPSTLDRDVNAALATALSDDHSSLSDAVASTAGGGGAAADGGWQLVELIQRVVAPDFWENQGGPGVIRYFAVRRVLVVRATSDVHEQLKDLLMALR